MSADIRSSWFSIAMRFAGKYVVRPFRGERGTAAVRGRKVVLYAAFKGMGDLLNAAPVIETELESGTAVILLVFPQIRGFVDLLDFGPNRNALTVCVLPASASFDAIREFFREMSRLAPDLLWYSPHAPVTVSSWRIPLLLWVVKNRYWPTAKLAGADSEKLSWLFDMLVPVDRSLPYGLREWTAFGMLDGTPASSEPPAARFKESLQRSRLLPRAHDIVIHPGASADNRKWPLSRHAELIKVLPRDRSIAVVGLPQDIAAMKSALPSDRGIHFLSGSLEDAIMSIAQARVAVTMDSGTMYFAKILGVPTVTLFGPSDPASVIRPDSNTIQIYDRKWPCQPCGLTACSQRSVLCMNSIDPKTVGRAVLQLLRKQDQ